MAHSFTATVRWTGNRGTGTSGYRDYARTHEVSTQGKPAIACSSDPAFRGDADRWNPEDMLVASISSCHMLWFLSLAAQAGLVVESYEDKASGTMRMNADGSGEFTEAMLRPHVTFSAGDPELADDLHHKAHEKCFIARSLNFEVSCEGTIAKA